MRVLLVRDGKCLEKNLLSKLERKSEEVGHVYKGVEKWKRNELFWIVRGVDQRASEKGRVTQQQKIAVRRILAAH